MASIYEIPKSIKSLTLFTSPSHWCYRPTFNQTWGCLDSALNIHWTTVVQLCDFFTSHRVILVQCFCNFCLPAYCNFCIYFLWFLPSPSGISSYSVSPSNNLQPCTLSSDATTHGSQNHLHSEIEAYSKRWSTCKPWSPSRNLNALRVSLLVTDRQIVWIGKNLWTSL